MQKHFFILIIIFVLGIIIGHYLVPTSSTPLSESSVLRTGVVETAEKMQVRYRDHEHLFSFMYPEEFLVSEFTETGNAKTLVFEVPGTEQAFQIFIAPFTGSTITKSDIIRQIPSGVIEDLKEVIIGDGIRALVFWSDVPILGKSREVWFIKNGYLYEVTTYAALDELMANILSTVRFSE